MATMSMLLLADGVTPVTVARRADTQIMRAFVYGALAVLDLLVVIAAFVLSDVIRHGSFTDSRVASYFLIGPVYSAVSFYGQAYTYGTIVSRRRGVAQVITSLPAAVAVTVVLIFALKNSEDVSRVAFFSGSIISLVGLVAVRLPLPGMIARLGRRFIARVLIVDGEFDDAVPASFERIDARALGIRPEADNPLMLQLFSRVVQGADRVVVSCPIERRAQWSLYLKSVNCTGELLVPELYAVDLLGDDGSSGLRGVRVSAGKLDIRNRVMKRCFDLAIAVPAVVLLSPLMLLVAIAIVLESGTPILFRQQRMGRANQLFNVLKFRSMFHESNDAQGDRSASRGDNRVTRVGRFLRVTSIDELPQLFNVIGGDMSLVGPRPHALGSRAGDALFWQVDQRYWLRHAIKPGLTGLAQVRGFRGATDSRADLAKRLESDIEYLADWSLVTDILILIRTLFVLRHRNAY